jgi:hypothetical protein
MIRIPPVKHQDQGHTSDVGATIAPSNLAAAHVEGVPFGHGSEGGHGR